MGGGGVSEGRSGGGEEGVEGGGVSFISYTLLPSSEAGARRRPQHKFSSPQ